MSSFFLPGEARDQRYVTLRDDDWPLVADGRQFVEELWAIAGSYVDLDIRQQARFNYLQRFWELYLTATLLQRGVELVPRVQRHMREGPDVLLADGRTWIEAVVATAGTGADAVKEPHLGVASWVPHDAMKLRLTNAIAGKHRKYRQYRSNGVVGPEDAFVVAINAAGIPSAKLEQSVPRIVSSVFPFGPEQVHINDTLRVTGRSFGYQPQVAKQSGELVSTGSFLDPSYCGISAVIYAWVDEIHRPSMPGSDFLLVHNPLATNPLPRGRFTFGREYWCEGKQVSWVTHT